MAREWEMAYMVHVAYPCKVMGILKYILTMEN